MRLIVLLLVLAVSTQAGLLDLGKVKDFFKGGNFGEKIKTATLSKFKKLFEKTGILSLGNKLAEMRSKVMKKLELSKAKKAEIDRKLKEIAAKVDNTVEKVKSTIFEINAVKNVGKALFQSDILLTKWVARFVSAYMMFCGTIASRRQLEEFMEGLEGGRAKRQAFKDENYPQTTWQQGVFYRFDNSTDYLTRKMFEMGAKEWEEATCVDFKEDKDGEAENSLILIKEDGCWSFVGRLGGEQPLSLGKGCEEVR
ncbi:astacin, partial [Ostertagia ostertagi]